MATPPPYVKLDRTKVFANLVAEMNSQGIGYKNTVLEVSALMDAISKDGDGVVTASLLEAEGIATGKGQDIIDTINNYHAPAAASLTAVVLAKLNNG